MLKDISIENLVVAGLMISPLSLINVAMINAVSLRILFRIRALGFQHWFGSKMCSLYGDSRFITPALISISISFL